MKREGQSSRTSVSQGSYVSRGAVDGGFEGMKRESQSSRTSVNQGSYVSRGAVEAVGLRG